MSKHRVYTIALESVSLTRTKVFLDGDEIGLAFYETTARAPRKWFCAINRELVIGLGFTQGFTSDTEAGFALVRKVADERLRDRIVEHLEATP